MKRFIYTLFACVILASCMSDEYYNYIEKKAYVDSLNSIVANDHKAKIKPLLELIRNDSALWDDTTCRMSDSVGNQFSFMIYYILEFNNNKEHADYTQDSLDRLEVLQNIREISTVGYNEGDPYYLQELGAWVNINKNNRSPYIVFIRTYAAAMPKSGRTSNRFYSGYFIGRALIMNYDTRQMMCTFDLYAQSSDTVQYAVLGKRYEDGPEHKLPKDLISNIKKEIRSQLKSLTGTSNVKIAGYDELDSGNRVK
ncbi:MAG: hypothetical protein ACRCYO_00965 [Bacteroidia bacterium]